MATLAIPNTIANGNLADGAELEANFGAIETHVNSELVNRDGSITMTSPLTLSGAPSADNHAARKKYVDDQITANSTDALTAKFVRTTDVALTTSTITTGTITFEAETTDTDGWWSSGATLTVPATGVYAIAMEFDLNKAIESQSVYTFIASLDNVGGTYGLLDLDPGNTGQGGDSDISAFRYSNGGVFYLRSGETFNLAYSFRSLSGSQSITIQEATLTITRLALI